jgi:endonuclease/exonuclease/phosphatase family metal-dependent hydrolase
MGWFLVQSARFLTACVFARASGADMATRPTVINFYGANAVSTDTVMVELGAVAVAAIAPLLALLFQRWTIMPTIAAAVAAAAHVMMVTEDPTIQVISGAVVLAAGGLYFAFAARHFADYFPLGLVAGLAADQVIRAMGDTKDHSLDERYLTAQTIVSVLVLGAAVLTWLTRETEPVEDEPAELDEAGEADDASPADEAKAEAQAEPEPPARPQRKGKITIWGGVALGGLMFLELALLGLPNAAAHISGTGYSTILPWLLGATVLPALPWVRGRARQFIAVFDGPFRGWVWFLLLGLSLVAGMRLGGLLGPAGLVVAQFLTVLALWWVIEPAREGERGVTGFSTALGWGVFGALAAGNFFTFVYGATSNELVAAFEGLGWVIFLLAAVLCCMPIIIARARIPWRGGPAIITIGLAVVAAAAVAAGVWATQPVVAQSRQGAQVLRIATFNIHSGYNTLYEPSLENIAHLIEVNQIDIALLQQVDAGRLTSNGVDQAWWLARRLRRELYYYPTNESVYGLAVLSRVRILDTEGSPLTSTGERTSVQRVRVCTAAGDGACPPEAIIDIYNTWLGRPERDVASEASDQWVQMSEVLRWVQQNIAGEADPWVVVGGTFNAAPDSLVYDQMTVYEYTDPFERLMVAPASSTTMCPGECLTRFDYLWLRNLTPQIAVVINPTNRTNEELDFDASDHRMVVVEVNLNREAAVGQ